MLACKNAKQNKARARRASDGMAAVVYECVLLGWLAPVRLCVEVVVLDASGVITKYVSHLLKINGFE